MPTYYVEDRARLVFEPKVEAGVLNLYIQVPGSTDRAMGQDEEVDNYTFRPAPNLPSDPTPPTNHVNVRVLDAANVMSVSTSGYTWTQFPVTGARQGVSTDLPIPASENAQMSIDIGIETAVGGGGGKRTQKVIIKHKPSTTG
jgi:hypothetical protein